jgi:hypothetical protein
MILIAAILNKVFLLRYSSRSCYTAALTFFPFTFKTINISAKKIKEIEGEAEHVEAFYIGILDR